MNTYKGIDYGMGTTNIDTNGIRYSVISQNDVGDCWYDESEPYYGEIECPNCEKIVDISDDECPYCEYDLYDAFNFMEALSYVYIDDNYQIESDEYNDLFILKSPYYTYAQYCSPCAPGACHLGNPLDIKDKNVKCYCLGHDWFNSGKAPYTVYDLKTDEIVKS